MLAPLFSGAWEGGTNKIKLSAVIFQSSSVKYLSEIADSTVYREQRSHDENAVKTNYKFLLAWLL